jgi:hypothetical protein
MPNPYTYDIKALEAKVDDIEESHARHRELLAEISRALDGVKVAFEGIKVKVGLIMWLLGAIAVGAITAGATLLAGALAKGHP